MSDILHEDAAGHPKTVKERGPVPYLHADDDLTCARCWPRAELIKHAARLNQSLQRTNDCSHSECIDREEDARADADRLAEALREVDYCVECDGIASHHPNADEALRQHDAAKEASE